MSNRRSKSLKNITYGIIGRLLTIIIAFVTRSLFIRILGTEFNGLNSLFLNILNVLNVAELGFSITVAYTLYEPLSKNDMIATAKIMNFLKLVYRIIAAVVAIAGLVCIPFLQHLINEPLDSLSFSLYQLRIYFSFYLLNTVSSYLLAYKRTLITASQDQYLINNTDNVAQIVLSIVQIILLILTKNYYAYLITMILKTIVTNLILLKVAKTKYPWLKNTKDKISKKESKAILKNVSAMMLYRIGDTVIYGTISIIISSFIGLIETGMYANYALIVTSICSIVQIIFNSINASVGNFCVTESIDKQYKLFKNVDFVGIWIAYFTFICFVCLFNPFIEIWLGEGNIFDNYIVVAIAFSPMVLFLRQGAELFKTAKGLFWNDRFKPIITAALGICIAIGLSYVCGIFGIVLGYALPLLFFSLPVELYVLFKHGFHMAVLREIIKKVIIVIFILLMGFLMMFLSSLITISGIGGLMLKLLLCLTVPNIIFVAFTFRTQEFKYFFNLILFKFKKIKKL